MPDFSLLGSLTRDLHQEFVRLYYILLPVFFALSIAIKWFQFPGGGPDFVDSLKRAFISTLLLAAFPEISRAIIFMADGISERIDNMNSLDAIIKMAEEKSRTYAESKNSVLLMFDDLMIAGLSFISYFFLYVARYLTIAMYHFFWAFFMISAPLLLLFNLFASTAQITTNLFKGMIEVACWKIVWAILGAMLSALSFGDMYREEGGYLVLIVMNFVIAIAMLMTPSLVKSLVGSGLQGMSSAIGAATVAAMAAVPAKAATVYSGSRSAASMGTNFIRTRVQSYRDLRKKKQDMYRY